MHLPTNPHRHSHACVPVAVYDSHGGLFMCRLIAFMAPVNGAGCFNEHSGGPLRPSCCCQGFSRGPQHSLHGPAQVADSTAPVGGSTRGPRRLTGP